MKITLVELRKQADNIDLWIDLLENAFENWYTAIQIWEIIWMTRTTIWELKRWERKMSYESANKIIMANSDWKFNK